MKKKLRYVFPFVLGLPLASHGQPERIEPPNWWAGMKNPVVELMVHGKNIAEATVEIKDPKIKVLPLKKTGNPNYLFIDLDLGEAAAGDKEILFTYPDGKTYSRIYPVLERDKGSAERKGFDNSDVIYLIMPDRFANGNPENDTIRGMREKKINREDITGRHGGDLKGISDHLEYLNDMGFTAIWLNPFLENDVSRTSYHGYSTTDYYRVDPRLGSNEEFIQLSKSAGEMGIKIIMDMIFNHIGITHWWMKDLPDEDWINAYPDFFYSNHRRTVNQDPYASEADRRGMIDGWFDKTMPDLNQKNPFLSAYLIQNSIWWIEYAGLAGIRMDTYPYPEKDMMAEWTKRVLDEYPNFNLVGEEWSYNPAIVSYWLKGKINKDGYEGGMPSMMDFPLQHALTESLTEEDTWSTGWIKLYEMIANDHLYPDPYNLVIFPDNHDMSRFYMQVGMDTALYKIGIIYFLTTRGIPQFLYGSEILMTHTESNHHGHIRKDFPGGWEGDSKNGFTGDGLSKEEREIQDFFKRILNWRRQNPVIHSGRMIHFAPENGVYVFCRYDETGKVLVLLNKTGKKQTLNTSRFSEVTGELVRGTDVITGKSFNLAKSITVPAKTGLVLELK